MSANYNSAAETYPYRDGYPQQFQETGSTGEELKRQ